MIVYSEAYNLYLIGRQLKILSQIQHNEMNTHKLVELLEHLIVLCEYSAFEKVVKEIEKILKNTKIKNHKGFDHDELRRLNMYLFDSLINNDLVYPDGHEMR